MRSYLLNHVILKGIEFRYSDTGFAIDFPVSKQDYLSINFTPTEYKIIKRLLFDLGETVTFAELIAVAFQPAYTLDPAMIRLLSKHISCAKRKLPQSVEVRNLYSIGYNLVLLHI